MTARRSGTGAFEMKALYTVPELAEAIEMHHRTFRRWLERTEVPLLKVGGAVAVPLVSFREALPDVWASLTALNASRQVITCPACGATISTACSSSCRVTARTTAAPASTVPRGGRNPR